MRNKSTIREEKRVPYVSTPELVAGWRTLWKAIETVLRVRFGEEGLKLMPENKQVYEEVTLSAIHEALLTASSLDDVRRIWTPENGK
jgi:hypothetical protein